MTLTYGRIRVVNLWDNAVIDIRMGNSILEITNGDVNIDYMIGAGYTDYAQQVVVSVFQGSAVLTGDITSGVMTRIVVNAGATVTYDQNSRESTRRIMNGTLNEFWNSVNRTFKYYNPTYKSDVPNAPPGTSGVRSDTAKVPSGYSLDTPAYNGGYNKLAYSEGHYGVEPVQPTVRQFDQNTYTEYNYDEKRGTWYPTYRDSGYGDGKVYTEKDDPFAGNPAHTLMPGMEMGFATPTERDLGVSTANPYPGPMMMTPDGHLMKYYDPALYSYYPEGETFKPVPQSKNPWARRKTLGVAVKQR
jgi:hypothetical protein